MLPNRAKHLKKSYTIFREITLHYTKQNFISCFLVFFDYMDRFLRDLFLMLFTGTFFLELNVAER